MGSNCCKPRNNSNLEENEIFINNYDKIINKYDKMLNKKHTTTWHIKMPNNCVICHEEYNLKSIVYITDCCHIYHYDCLNKWFNIKEICPLCNTELHI